MNDVLIRNVDPLDLKSEEEEERGQGEGKRENRKRMERK